MSPSFPARAKALPTQRAVNASLWSGKDLVKHYVNSTLKPPERAWLSTYREELSGKVLELGCGAGRFTGHAAALGGEVLATDVSELMLRETHRRYGVATARIDLHELSAVVGATYDAVVLTANLLDILGDDDRNVALDQLCDLLAPQGVLLFSSHNLDAAHLIPADLRLRGLGPLALLRRVVALPVSTRNRRRLRPLEQTGPHFAVLNDMAHHWSVLHYYIGQQAQQQQLADHGLVLDSCLALDGLPSSSSVTSTELHYAARRCSS